MENYCEEVRRSAALVASNCEHVKLNEPEIKKLVTELQTKLEKTGIVFDKWADWHLSDIAKYSLDQVTAYVFVVDAMNFCFWPDNAEGDFEYSNMTRNLEKLLDAEPLFFCLERLSGVKAEELQVKVFDGRDFALMDERARLIRQIASYLQAR